MADSLDAKSSRPAKAGGIGDKQRQRLRNTFHGYRTSACICASASPTSLNRGLEGLCVRNPGTDKDDTRGCQADSGPQSGQSLSSPTLRTARRAPRGRGLSAGACLHRHVSCGKNVHRFRELVANCYTLPYPQKLQFAHRMKVCTLYKFNLVRLRWAAAATTPQNIRPARDQAGQKKRYELDRRHVSSPSSSSSSRTTAAHVASRPPHSARDDSQREIYLEVVTKRSRSPGLIITTW
jgi:hypothetical protein